MYYYLLIQLGGSFTFEPEHLLDDQGSCPLSPAAKQILREKVFGEDLVRHVSFILTFWLIFLYLMVD